MCTNARVTDVSIYPSSTSPFLKSSYYYYPTYSKGGGGTLSNKCWSGLVSIIGLVIWG